LADSTAEPINVTRSGGCLALDYGRRRVGVAASEAGISIAFGVTTLLIHGLKDLMGQLEPILKQRRPRTIILGFPVGLEGVPGPVAGEILTLSGCLQNCGWEVVLVDEALSSRKADHLLRSRGRRSSKEAVDRSAAAVLLQEYLDGQLTPLTQAEIQEMYTIISGTQR
jgi:putative holliday junction resolvase